MSSTAVMTAMSGGLTRAETAKARRALTLQ
jgi:hypothetical protein